MFYFIKNKLSETFWHIFILDISLEKLYLDLWKTMYFFKDSFVVVNCNGLSNYLQLSGMYAKNQMLTLMQLCLLLKLSHDYWKGLSVSAW